MTAVLWVVAVLLVWIAVALTTALILGPILGRRNRQIPRPDVTVVRVTIGDQDVDEKIREQLAAHDREVANDLRAAR